MEEHLNCRVEKELIAKEYIDANNILERSSAIELTNFLSTIIVKVGTFSNVSLVQQT